MSSRASVTPLYLEPQPSRRMLQLLLWSHAVSAVVLMVLALQLPGLVLLLPLLPLSYRHYRRRYLAPVRIARESDGSWLWHGVDGAVIPVRLLPDTLLTPWLVLLHACEQVGRRQYSVLLLSDSLPADQFRALRVALRLERVDAKKISNS